MSRTVLAVIAVLLLCGGLVGCDDKKSDPRKPSWWPEPGTKKFGLDWPPPKPKGWPANKKWPPLREVGEDPEFWTKLFGEDIDTDKDKRLKQAGELGNSKFRYNFDRISTVDPNKKPGCGLHVTTLYSYKSPTTCTPYPEAEIRAHCKKVFDEKKALQTCRRNCARNERQCRRARFFEPPFEAYWRCETFSCFDHLGKPEACGEQTQQSDCAAFYLCDCFEL